MLNLAQRKIPPDMDAELKQQKVDGLPDRLDQALAIAGRSARSVLKEAELGANYISQLKSGRTKDVTVSTLRRIASICGVDFNWLATGEGSPELAASHDIHENVSGNETVEILKLAETVFEESERNFSSDEKGRVWRALIRTRQNGIEVTEDIVRSTILTLQDATGE